MGQDAYPSKRRPGDPRGCVGDDVDVSQLAGFRDRCRRRRGRRVSRARTEPSPSTAPSVPPPRKPLPVSAYVRSRGPDAAVVRPAGPPECGEKSPRASEPDGTGVVPAARGFTRPRRLSSERRGRDVWESSSGGALAR